MVDYRTMRRPIKDVRHRKAAFTLAEVLVSVGVLVLLVLLATQLLNSAATITNLGHKQMDADSQARQLLDRMAIDFAQLVKRSDVDFWAKGTVNPPNSAGGAMAGNDQITFYSSVPGYYPSGYSTGSQSPVSLVAYRINSQNQMERMGKGLVWNGVSSTDTPVVFMPIKISAAFPSINSGSDPSSEVIGPQAFRFEYCYLLKADGSLSITPPTDVSGIAAIIADIAVIDSKSKVLLSNAQIAKFSTPNDSHFLRDYASGMTPGQLRTLWQNKLNGIIDPNSPDFDSSMPRPGVSGIRLYERFFYLSPPVL